MATNQPPTDAPAIGLQQFVKAIDAMIEEKTPHVAILHDRISMGVAGVASLSAGAVAAFAASAVALGGLGVAQGSPTHWGVFLGAAAVGTVAAFAKAARSEAVLGPKASRDAVERIDGQMDAIIEQAAQAPGAPEDFASRLTQYRQRLEKANRPEGLSGNQLAGAAFVAGAMLGPK